MSDYEKHFLQRIWFWALEKERARKEQELVKAHIQEQKKRIGQFFGLKAPEQSPKAPVSDKTPNEKPTISNNSLFKMQELQKQMDQLTKEHNEKQTALLLKEAERKTQFMNKIINILKK